MGLSFRRCFGLLVLFAMMGSPAAWSAEAGGLKLIIPQYIDLAGTDCYETIKIQDPATGKIIYSTFKQLVERDQVIRMGAGTYRLIIEGCGNRVAFTRDVQIIPNQVLEAFTGYFYNYSSAPVPFEGFNIEPRKSYLVWRNKNDTVFRWYAPPGSSLVEVPRDYILGNYGMNEYVNVSTRKACSSYLVNRLFLLNPGETTSDLRLNNIPVRLQPSEIPGVAGKIESGTMKLVVADGATVRIYSSQGIPVKLATNCMDVFISDDLPYSLQIQLPVGSYRAETLGMAKGFEIKKDESTWVDF